MAKKKNSEPELSDADQALVQRVDAMMDPNQPEPAAASPGSPADTPTPIDIFDGQPPISDNPAGSAPSVPSKLLKEIGVKKPKKTTAIKPTPEAASTEPVAGAVTPPVEEAASDPAGAKLPAAVPDDAADPLASDATDKAVDDIVSEDSNDLLKVSKLQLPYAVSKAAVPKASPAGAQVKKAEHHNPANFIVLTLLTIVLLVLIGLYLTHHNI